MDNNALMGLGLAVMGVVLIVGLAIGVFVVWLVYNAMLGVPPKHRPMEPSMVWLMLIPCFNFFWIFKVFPPMMAAYKAALEEKNLPVEGDNGQGLALAYCICAVCGIVPYLGILASLAALVLFILTLVKAYDCKKRLA